MDRGLVQPECFRTDSYATVGAPVQFVANASTTCSKGVAAMGIYVNNQLNYTSKGGSCLRELENRNIQGTARRELPELI